MAPHTHLWRQVPACGAANGIYSCEMAMSSSHMKFACGVPMQIAAWALGIVAILCVPLLPFTFLLTALASDKVGIAMAPLALVPLAPWSRVN